MEEKKEDSKGRILVYGWILLIIFVLVGFIYLLTEGFFFKEKCYISEDLICVDYGYKDKVFVVLENDFGNEISNITINLVSSYCSAGDSFQGTLSVKERKTFYFDCQERKLKSDLSVRYFNAGLNRTDEVKGVLYVKIKKI